MVIDVILDRPYVSGYTSKDILSYKNLCGEADWFKAFKKAVKNQDERAAKNALIDYVTKEWKFNNEGVKLIEKFNWVVK